MSIKESEGLPEDLELVTRQLYDSLQELEVESVDFLKADSLPEGSKGIDPVLLGVLTVSIGPLVLTKLLDFLHDWLLSRGGQTRVTIKIQTSKDSFAEIEVSEAISREKLAELMNIVDLHSHSLRVKR